MTGPAFHRRNGSVGAGVFQPFGERNTATFDNRSHGAKGKNTAAMLTAINASQP